MCIMYCIYCRPVHRYPAVRVAGPAIFNPSSRVPAEAYNYQFPRGSIRSTASDGSMSSEGLSSRTGPSKYIITTSVFPCVTSWRLVFGGGWLRPSEYRRLHTHSIQWPQSLL